MRRGLATLESVEVLGTRLLRGWQVAVIRLLRNLSEYLAQRKGLPVMVGVLLVVFNFLVLMLLPSHWLARTHLFLHLGVAIGLLGVLLGDAL